VPVIHLYQNQNPVPRAFLVDNFVILNKKEILKSLFEDAFDLTKTALLEKTPGISHDFNNNGDISEVRRIFEGDSRFDFVVKTSKGKLLILSDTFYPGWHAYIDEKEVKIYQADYIFRAVEIPPGEHKVEFIYAPASFKIGATMSLIALFLIVVISLVLWKKSI
jgi:hypothetical protein